MNPNSTTRTHQTVLLLYYNKVKNE